MIKQTLLSVYNPVANFHKNRIFKASHQVHFQDRTEEKWALIAGALASEPGSLIDIGCSEGVFTARAAERGYCAWGVEGKSAAVDRASQTHNAETDENVFFAAGLLTPQAARHLPTFDVILLLSVLHQLFKHHGEAAAIAMVGDLLASCRQQLFLEMAGINRKYGHAVLARENDRSSVDDLVRRLLPAGWHMRWLGNIAYTEEEPHRFLYVLERAG